MDRLEDDDEDGEEGPSLEADKLLIDNLSPASHQETKGQSGDTPRDDIQVERSAIQHVEDSVAERNGIIVSVGHKSQNVAARSSPSNGEQV